jgi:BMFP domain-containing protein YqiC
MTDSAWELFDALCKQLHRTARRVEELESRVTTLERELRERDSNVVEFPLNDEREVMEV